MKKPIFLAAILLLASTAALADTTFYNQTWDGGNTNRCDTNTPTCASTGWTVYDNFTVPTGVKNISDFTYTDFIFSGSWSDYVSTNWTVFGPNASNPFGTPTYSGTSVASLTDLGGGNMMLTITGLNLAITPGNWIVGFQNNMTNSSDITGRGTSGTGDGVYWQQDNAAAFQFTLGGNTAFSVSTSSTVSPEPSTLLMLGTGLLGGISFIRRKLS